MEAIPKSPSHGGRRPRATSLSISFLFLTLLVVEVTWRWKVMTVDASPLFSEDPYPFVPLAKVSGGGYALICPDNSFVRIHPKMLSMLEACRAIQRSCLGKNYCETIRHFPGLRFACSTELQYIWTSDDVQKMECGAKKRIWLRQVRLCDENDNCTEDATEERKKSCGNRSECEAPKRLKAGERLVVRWECVAPQRFAYANADREVRIHSLGSYPGFKKGMGSMTRPDVSIRSLDSYVLESSPSMNAACPLSDDEVTCDFRQSMPFPRNPLSPPGETTTLVDNLSMEPQTNSCARSICVGGATCNTLKNVDGPNPLDARQCDCTHDGTRSFSADPTTNTCMKGGGISTEKWEIPENRMPVSSQLQLECGAKLIFITDAWIYFGGDREAVNVAGVVQAECVGAMLRSCTIDVRQVYMRMRSWTRKGFRGENFTEVVSFSVSYQCRTSHVAVVGGDFPHVVQCTEGNQPVSQTLYWMQSPLDTGSKPLSSTQVEFIPPKLGNYNRFVVIPKRSHIPEPLGSSELQRYYGKTIFECKPIPSPHCASVGKYHSWTCSSFTAVRMGGSTQETQSTYTCEAAAFERTIRWPGPDPTSLKAFERTCAQQVQLQPILRRYVWRQGDPDLNIECVPLYERKSIQFESVIVKLDSPQQSTLNVTGGVRHFCMKRGKSPNSCTLHQDFFKEDIFGFVANVQKRSWVGEIYRADILVWKYCGALEHGGKIEANNMSSGASVDCSVAKPIPFVSSAYWETDKGPVGNMRDATFKAREQCVANPGKGACTLYPVPDVYGTPVGPKNTLSYSIQYFWQCLSQNSACQPKNDRATHVNKHCDENGNFVCDYLRGFYATTQGVCRDDMKNEVGERQGMLYVLQFDVGFYDCLGDTDVVVQTAVGYKTSQPSVDMKDFINQKIISREQPRFFKCCEDSEIVVVFIAYDCIAQLYS